MTLRTTPCSLLLGDDDDDDHDYDAGAGAAGAVDDLLK